MTTIRVDDASVHVDFPGWMAERYVR